MRLGQRLSGGAAGPLSISRLSITEDSLTLHVEDGSRELVGDAVERRHRQLAANLGRVARLG
jgi:exopolyphosphatase/guanosine-5'-triphosphate,3'-diphosphate pyrophosphatase